MDTVNAFSSGMGSSTITSETAELSVRILRLERRLHITWAMVAIGLAFGLVAAGQPEGFAQTIGVTLTSLNNAVIALQGRATALETKTANMSVLTDPYTNQPTVRFDDVNVQVYNSSGSAGLGNLLIGPNTPAAGDTNYFQERTGQGNLIIGAANSYTGTSSLIAGYSNTVSGSYSSVTGGNDNLVDANYASVSGGYQNHAGGMYSSVSGGSVNYASGLGSAISGGNAGSASGTYSSISGGLGTFVQNTESWGVSTTNRNTVINTFSGNIFSLPN